MVALMLPGTDRIELLEDVPAASDAPVITMSAYGRDGLIARPFSPAGPYVLGHPTNDYAE